MRQPHVFTGGHARHFSLDTGKSNIAGLNLAQYSQVKKLLVRTVQRGVDLERSQPVRAAVRGRSTNASTRGANPLGLS